MQPSPAGNQVDITRIHVAPGHNPRRHFGSADYQRLVASIRTNGLIQPLTVRPRADGDFELISGERRLRALREIGAAAVPVNVRDVDDATARVLALCENLDRADISPAEEAQYVRGLLDAHDGDRDEVRLRLGWSPAKLASRLALLHCAEGVLAALAAGEISLGIAELLAGLPHDLQDKALPRIVENKLTVLQVRDQVEGFALPLAHAIFDLSGCNACPRNSNVQGSLFETSISGGKCTGRACYSEKTQAALQARRAELEETYAVVALKSEKEADTHAPLAAEGASGVGAAQFAQCRGCKFFGAVLDDRLGASTGQVEAPRCFSLGCRAEKIAERQADDREAAEAVRAASAPAATTGTTSAKAPAQKAVSNTRAKGKPAPAALKSTVREVYEGVIRDAVASTVKTEPAAALALLCVAAARLLADAGAGRDGLARMLGRHGGGRDDLDAAVAQLAVRPRDELQASLMDAMVRFVSDKPGEAIHAHHVIQRPAINASMAKARQIDLAPHVRIDRAFLDAHTKGEIETLLTESGFKAALQAKPDGDKQWKALLAGKKEALVEGVLAAGYDFAGFVPASLAAMVQAAK